MCPFNIFYRYFHVILENTLIHFLVENNMKI